MNKISLSGRLTKDPSTTKTSGNLVFSRFDVACKRRIKSADSEPETDFFHCILWKDRAENFCKHCKKGTLLHILGSMCNRKYEGEDGTEKSVWEVWVDDYEVLAQPKVETEKEKPSNETQKQKNVTKQQGFIEIGEIDDDNLPF